ncbi:hypothetical protein niasHT_011659 [Heterodera trifolii]|uniref:Uncharacterized protein n=1 Tax=Heterodera trifolii TaxID=157864 RepID=A0ABD2LJ99_9BILA
MVEPRHRSPALLIAGTPQPGKFKEQQQVQGQVRERIKGKMGWRMDERWREILMKRRILSHPCTCFFSQTAVRYFLPMLICPLAEVFLHPLLFLSLRSGSQTNAQQGKEE